MGWDGAGWVEAWGGAEWHLGMGWCKAKDERRWAREWVEGGRG